jgi:hypothetical protein
LHWHAPCVVCVCEETPEAESCNPCVPSGTMASGFALFKDAFTRLLDSEAAREFNTVLKTFIASGVRWRLPLASWRRTARPLPEDNPPPIPLFSLLVAFVRTGRTWKRLWPSSRRYAPLTRAAASSWPLSRPSCPVRVCVCACVCLSLCLSVYVWLWPCVGIRLSLADAWPGAACGDTVQRTCNRIL